MSVYTYLNPIASINNQHVTQLADYPLRIVCANFEIIEPTPPKCLPCAPLMELPFMGGDSFYFQFINQPPIYSAIITVYSPTGTIISVNVVGVIPIKTKKGWVHTIIVAAPIFPNSFYIKIQLGSIIHYTNLYCRVFCATTLLLEGIYTKTDCFGFDYTVEGYRNLIRLNGTIEKTIFTIEAEVSANNRRIKQSTTDGYTLILEPLPPIIVQQIERILGAKQVLINGVEYEFSGQIEKNIERNRNWFIEITLSKLICHTNLTC